MSKKFKAINRLTGEDWKPKKIDTGKQYLVLYDSGYAVVVTEDFYTYIEPLDTKEWEVVMKGSKHETN